jgi:acetyl esterase/lipase
MAHHAVVNPVDQDAVLHRRPPAFDERLKYGRDSNQFGDLRLPSRAQPRLAVMIHGGFWRAKYGLEHAGHLCAALTRAGFATFNLEYRRVGNPGGGWPGSLEDVAAGLKFMREQAGKYGIEAHAPVVIGHSAGGQLAVCLAAREKEIAGAVALAGVLDLRRAWELRLSNDAVCEFLGGDPKEKEGNYRQASPVELKIEKMRQLIIHGAADQIVPLDFSRNYAQQKIKNGEAVRLVEIPSAGHFDLIDPESPFWSEVERNICALEQS